MKRMRAKKNQNKNGETYESANCTSNWYKKTEQQSLEFKNTYCREPNEKFAQQKTRVNSVSIFGVDRLCAKKFHNYESSIVVSKGKNLMNSE